MATISKDTRSTEQVYKDSLLQSDKNSAANDHNVNCDLVVIVRQMICLMPKGQMVSCCFVDGINRQLVG